MALNDGLTRFRLQQERNQATLSTIAATKAAASSSATNSQHHPPPPTPAPAPAPAAVRFSDDIPRPNDPRSRMEVAAEVKQMFHEVKLLQDMLDIEKELRKNGEKPATDTAKRRAAEKIHGRQPEPEKARKKPRGITSRTSSPMSISRDSLTCL